MKKDKRLYLRDIKLLLFQVEFPNSKTLLEAANKFKISAAHTQQRAGVHDDDRFMIISRLHGAAEYVTMPTHLLSLATYPCEDILDFQEHIKEPTKEQQPVNSLAKQIIWMAMGGLVVAVISQTLDYLHRHA